MVSGEQDAAVAGGGGAEDRGEVGDRHGRCLVQDQERVAGQRLGAAGFAAVFQVAEELGDVAGGGDACFVQDVAGGLGGGQAVHVADAGLLPQGGDRGGGVGLARSGRADQDLGAAIAGEHGERGGGLVQAQA